MRSILILLLLVGCSGKERATETGTSDTLAIVDLLCFGYCRLANATSEGLTGGKRQQPGLDSDLGFR